MEYLYTKYLWYRIMTRSNYLVPLLSQNTWINSISSIRILLFFNSTPGKSESIWIKKSFCILSNLSCTWIYNRYSSFKSSIINFQIVVTSLDRVSVCFQFFQCKKCIRGPSVSTHCFTASEENKRAVSNPVHSW